jgi:hypothetical protein
MAVELAEGLEPAVEPVYQEIIGYLQSQGAHVAFILPEDALGLWETVLRGLGDASRDEVTFERGTAAFVRALAEQEDFDLFVLPSLGYRQAAVEDGYARWDGVTRRISAPSSTVYVPAMSIHTLVFGHDGRVVFRRWSGLDLVYESRDPERGVGPSEKRLRERIEFLREGVARALTPDAVPDS